MAGGRERAAMVHCGGDGDAGRHLVVEQASHFGAQERGETVVQVIVGAGVVGVEAAGEIAFEAGDDLLHLVGVLRQYDQ